MPYTLTQLRQLAGDPTGRRIVVGLVRPITAAGVPYGDPELVVSAGLDDQGRLNFRVVGRSIQGRKTAGAGRANSLSWNALCYRGLVHLGADYSLTSPAAIRGFLTPHGQRQPLRAPRGRPVRPAQPVVADSHPSSRPSQPSDAYRHDPPPPGGSGRASRASSALQQRSQERGGEELRAPAAERRRRRRQEGPERRRASGRDDSDVGRVLSQAWVAVNNR